MPLIGIPKGSGNAINETPRLSHPKNFLISSGDIVNMLQSSNGEDELAIFEWTFYCSGGLGKTVNLGMAKVLSQMITNIDAIHLCG
jgi:hypothetical protein